MPEEELGNEQSTKNIEQADQGNSFNEQGLGESTEPKGTTDEQANSVEEIAAKAAQLEKDYKELQSHTTRVEQMNKMLKEQQAIALGSEGGLTGLKKGQERETFEENIRKVEEAIAENKRLGYRTAELEAQRFALVEQAKISELNARNEEFSTFYADKANKDLTPDDYEEIGRIMTEEESKGHPVTIRQAASIWRGKNSEKRMEAAVKKALEEYNRGGSARGHGGGTPATPVNSTEVDEMRRFANELGNPDGVKIPPEAYK